MPPNAAFAQVWQADLGGYEPNSNHIGLGGWKVSPQPTGCDLAGTSLGAVFLSPQIWAICRQPNFWLEPGIEVSIIPRAVRLGALMGFGTRWEWDSERFFGFGLRTKQFVHQSSDTSHVRLLGFRSWTDYLDQNAFVYFIQQEHVVDAVFSLPISPHEFSKAAEYLRFYFMRYRFQKRTNDFLWSVGFFTGRFELNVLRATFLLPYASLAYAF